MRRVILSCLLVLALVPGWSRDPRLELFGKGPASMASERVMLDPADPARRRVGALTFLGGVALTSPDRAFGGFSALHVAGDRFTLLSDGGGIARFRMKPRGQVLDVRFADLPTGPGTGWDKRDRDSEAMAVDPATGAVLVAFERANAIWRYSSDFARAAGRVKSPAMQFWRANSGAEAMAARSGGGFIVLSEVVTRGSNGLIFDGDPTAGATPRPFRLRVPAGWRTTDAAELPDGGMLVLLRRIERLRFASAIMLVEPGAIRPDAVVRGRVIATLADPLIHDNFEGLAVTRERGRTILWLVSDDNMSVFQRTLLLKFVLDGGALRRPGDSASPRPPPPRPVS